MHEIMRKISNIGIVPVIAINDAKKAVPLAKALVAGGIPVAEVTFRTDAAEEAIRLIATEVPEMLVGAGTILTKDQVDRAHAAGSKFMVSPGFNPEITKYALSKGIVFAPGTATPGEMEQAMELGLDVVKFFPAEQNGGIAKIKSVAAPYGKLHFMPTGGVTADNLMDYLSFDKVVACGGTWMVKADLINDDKFDEITRLTRQAVNAMLGFELAHIGINCEDEQAAIKAANLFGMAFGFEGVVGNSSVFCGKKEIELMKTPFKGKYGHIAIRTNTIDRAKVHLEMRGFEFDESSRVAKDGKTIAIYMKDEIAGFAVHLLQK